jgi:hypothetical protein
MAQFCDSCSRINPDDARYCHFDGSVLPQRGHAGGRLNAAVHPFPTPLAFTPGRTCVNFEQLLRACQDDWAAGVELLRRGDLAALFARVGRPDLTAAAAGFARAADLDSGLDELLALLPGPSRSAARLRVQPPEVLLGPLRAGQDSSFTLRLSNLGDRLLAGMVVSECPWLSPGDQDSVREKSFRFHAALAFPVRVIGKRLLARAAPHEGALSIVSNAGNVEVRVRAAVPPQPFPRGVLAGARTPRELVDRVRAATAEAVLLFDSGEVAAWYAANGWPYPVSGPCAAGPDAVRQFFAALGLPDDFSSLKAPVARWVSPAAAPVAAPAAIPVAPLPFVVSAVKSPPPAPVVLPPVQSKLAGLRAPHELVEWLVRATPAEVVDLFDSGEVARWYAANGWDYPVRGPRAAGPDAVRQFLQALGPTFAALAAGLLEAIGPAAGLTTARGIPAQVRTPRDLVEWVRAAPAEAAALFDSGEVARWYAANGWPYPVSGPRAAGPDAVRQFFAALGQPDPFVPLPAEPPRTAGRRKIPLQGTVRERVALEVHVRSKGIVGPTATSAQATSDQSWLDVQVTRLDRDATTLLLVVPAVPDAPGTTLEAQVSLLFSDKRRMTIPVTLTVTGKAPAAEPARA